MRKTSRGLAAESHWREGALRTNLWLIPVIESLAAVALFAVTVSLDEAAFHGGHIRSVREPPRNIPAAPLRTECPIRFF